VRGPVLLVAGGTGGHLFPALALREALAARGVATALATDPRVGEWVEGVPPEETHVIPSASLGLGSPAKIARALGSLTTGLLAARRLLARLDPSLVIGFGGYPSVPPVLAACLGRRPAAVHEQNAVLGRANRLLIRAGAHLATGFPAPKGGERARAVTHVGNPVRAAVRRAAGSPYAPPGQGEAFRLLVFGGSQGARTFSERVPQALGRLPTELRGRLTVTQQARPEDIEAARTRYAGLGIAAELAPFFTDLPQRMAAAHLVISRAGASTVSELAVIGRPAILVPYPHALDHDQAANAEALVAAGGGWLMREAEMTAEALADRIAGQMRAPDALRDAADAAKAVGRPDAAEGLADLVMKLAAQGARGRS